MDDPTRCLQCGRIIIRRTVGLYFCSEECVRAHLYDQVEGKEYKEGIVWW